MPTIMDPAAAGAVSRFNALGKNIELISPDQKCHRFGSGEPLVTARFHTPRAWRQLLSLDENGIVESYLAGELDIDGSFEEALRCRGILHSRRSLAWMKRFIMPWLFGQVKTNRKAIGHHYELDAAFYLSFLDPVWPCYSQGIYESPDECLTSATERKLEYARQSCKIDSGSEVLEVGPGWGAWVSYLLPKGARVKGLTNSPSMRQFLESRFPHPHASFEAGDFLKYAPPRRFAALTMMGVLEHLPWYEHVCRQIRTLVEPGGYAYLDASAAKEKYEMSEFIYKHMYPYNHSFLHLEGFLRAVDRVKLQLVALHDDSESYWRTIKAWATNFDAHREALEKVYGSYQVRRFRMYLWGSAHGFETGSLQCHRLVLRVPA
jgi:cyclopropane-fatty-acyl-phospholipid synthase